MVYMAKGGFWIMVGRAVYLPLAFILSIAFANLLPKTEYGIYQYILSLLGILTIPTFASMATAITQAAARGYEGSLIPAMKAKIKWGSLGGVASLALAAYYYWQNSDTLAVGFLITAIFIPFYNAFSLYGSILEGRKDFKTSTKFSIVYQIIYTIVLGSTMLLTNNIYIILILNLGTANLINIIFLRKIKKKFKVNDQVDPKTIPYGIYLSLLGIIQRIGNYIDKVILWHFLGPIDVAIYTFAKAPVEQLSNSLQSLYTLSFPKFSAQEEGLIKKSLPAKVKKLFLIIIPIIIIYYFAVPYFYKFFYPQYLDAIRASQYYCLILLTIPVGMFSNAMLAKAKKKEITLIRTVIPPIKIALLIILISAYGIIGAIFAQLLVGMITALLIFYLFIKLK